MVSAMISSYQVDLGWPRLLILISCSVEHAPRGSYSSFDCEGTGYGANFGDEQLRLFPGSEVAASLRLAPVDDRWEPRFGPLAEGLWYLLWEDGASSRNGDAIATGSGEPGGNFCEALPVQPS